MSSHTPDRSPTDHAQVLVVGFGAVGVAGTYPRMPSFWFFDETRRPPAPLWPSGSNSSRGPRRALVLDTYSKPIPGQFASGELGQAAGPRSPSVGSNPPEALSFGQTAPQPALTS